MVRRRKRMADRRRETLYSSCCCLFAVLLCHSLEIFLDVLGRESFGSLLVVSDETCHNSVIAYIANTKKRPQNPKNNLRRKVPQLLDYHAHYLYGIGLFFSRCLNYLIREEYSKQNDTVTVSVAVLHPYIRN